MIIALRYFHFLGCKEEKSTSYVFASSSVDVDFAEKTELSHHGKDCISFGNLRKFCERSLEWSAASASPRKFLLISELH